MPQCRLRGYSIAYRRRLPSSTHAEPEQWFTDIVVMPAAFIECPSESSHMNAGERRDVQP